VSCRAIPRYCVLCRAMLLFRAMAWRAAMLFKSKKYTRDQVFVAGGLPTVTYVSREHLNLERKLKRALAQPHSFASVTGTSKSGKTVLCRNTLEGREFVWLEGGQIKGVADLWSKIASALQQPTSLTFAESEATGIETSGGASGKLKIPLVAEGGISGNLKGSRISNRMATSQQGVDLEKACAAHMIAHRVILVIDDFHYVDRKLQTEMIRSLKGPAFNGLKVLLLSVSYKAYEAIQAETEITGRFVHVDVPDWSRDDLSEIATKGFPALNVNCTKSVVALLAGEANGSPQLMQQFCWELCFEKDIEETCAKQVKIDSLKEAESMFETVAKDAGQPIYDKLAAGPQARSTRIKRPLKSGGSVDIYEGLLIAIAQTGPKRKLSYDELRSSLSNILLEKVPQKVEVANALSHLAKISGTIAEDSRPIDWSESDRMLVLADPMFRFFLKWRLARVGTSTD
jgi:hypothetical protein